MPPTLGSNDALNETLQTLIRNTITPATRASYDAGFDAYSRFLLLNNVTWNANAMPPINEDILIYFVAHCLRILSLRICTIQLYLCGIRYHYLWRGLNPSITNCGHPLPRLAAVIKSAKKTQGAPSKERLPITGSILKNMCIKLNTKQLNLSQYTKILLKAAFTSAFYGFLSCGEFTSSTTPFDPALNLCLEDIRFDSDLGCVNVTLKSSKTDFTRQGVLIRAFRNNSVTCPYQSLEAYKLSRTEHFMSSYKEVDSPFFFTESGDPLSRNVFVPLLRQVLLSVGLDDKKYSGHSFRIGAGSSAGRARIEDHLIKTLGRWSSDCYQRYIHTSLDAIKRAQIAMMDM